MCLGCGVRVLGIDPGLTRCGIGVIDARGRALPTFVHVSVVRTTPAQELSRRLHLIGEAIDARIAEFRPDVVALERVFAQQNVRTVMGIAQISGVALYLCATRGIPVVLHTPTEVKAAVTGYGSADKAQVGRMVARILGLDAVPKPADAADALALAICHGWRGGVPTQTPVASGTLTPAQLAWQAAEMRSRGVKNP